MRLLLGQRHHQSCERRLQTLLQPYEPLIEPQHFPSIAPAREVGRELRVGPRKYDDSRNDVSRPTDGNLKPGPHNPQVPPAILWLPQLWRVDSSCCSRRHASVRHLGHF